MKILAYVFAGLVLIAVAANGGHAAQGQAPKKGGQPSAVGKAGQGQAPKNGGQPGGGKGSSSVNGTGMGARH